jgi:hypothetical protein
MTASNFILPRALLKALGPAPDGEDLKAIIVDLAACGRIEAVASVVIDYREIEDLQEEDPRITAHQWQRIVHQNKVEDVWKNGTVRLDSDLKNHLYYVEIIGIKFDETQVREALERFGLTLCDNRSSPESVGSAPSSPSEGPVAQSSNALPPAGRPLPSLDEVSSVSVHEAAQHLRIGRTSVYARIKEGTLVARKVGGSTIITSKSVKKIIDG